MKEVIIALLAAGAIYLVLGWWMRWQTERIASRVADAALDFEGARTKLNPESQFKISLAEDGVTCERPDGLTKQVAWNDLCRVDILSTADGPWQPDTFWVLSGSARGCVIPWGATGDDKLLERLQQLPGFDNGTVISGASNTEESIRKCWEKALAA